MEEPRAEQKRWSVATPTPSRREEKNYRGGRVGCIKQANERHHTGEGHDGGGGRATESLALIRLSFAGDLSFLVTTSHHIRNPHGRQQPLSFRFEATRLPTDFSTSNSHRFEGSKAVPNREEK